MCVCVCHAPTSYFYAPSHSIQIVFAYCVCGWMGLLRCVYICVCVCVCVGVYVLWYAKAKENRWLQDVPGLFMTCCSHKSMTHEFMTS